MTSVLPSPVEPVPAPPASDTDLRGRAIVIVDDKENVRSMLRDVLEAHGLRVFLAPDGFAALDVIRETHPDLILSDINMAGLNGYELLTEVRRDPAMARLPFVLMTGKADLRSMRSGMSLGADDYLPKPFSISELIEAIKRRLERQAALGAQAEERMASLRNSITSILPHELLTPLNGILGVAALLEDGGVHQDDLGSYAEMLRESGERLHHLVLNFLTLARIELLAADPEHRPGEVKDETSTDGGWLAALATDVATRWHRAEDLGTAAEVVRVAISPQNLSKALVEVIDNAFKFSPPGSRVMLLCTAETQWATFTVRDAGRGIRAEDLAHIGAFQQFDRRLYEQQGSGLGLIIAKRLVELHGGEFQIESAPERGTTVRLRLPRRGGPDPTA